MLRAAAPSIRPRFINGRRTCAIGRDIPKLTLTSQHPAKITRPRQDRGAHPDPGGSPDGDTAGQADTRADMRRVFDDTLVVHARRRVDDHVLTESNLGIDDGAGGYHGPHADLHRGGHDGRGMERGRERPPTGARGSSALETRMTIPEAHEEEPHALTLEAFEALEAEVPRGVQELARARFGGDIVEEACDDLLTPEPDDVGHDLCMSSRPPDHQRGGGRRRRAGPERAHSTLSGEIVQGSDGCTTPGSRPMYACRRSPESTTTNEARESC